MSMLFKNSKNFIRPTTKRVVFSPVVLSINNSIFNTFKGIKDAIEQTIEQVIDTTNHNNIAGHSNDGNIHTNNHSNSTSAHSNGSNPHSNHSNSSGHSNTNAYHSNTHSNNTPHTNGPNGVNNHSNVGGYSRHDNSSGHRNTSTGHINASGHRNGSPPHQNAPFHANSHAQSTHTNTGYGQAVAHVNNPTHSNTPHANGTVHSNSGHVHTNSGHGNTSPHSNNPTHDNTGFDHQNYIPSAPYFYNGMNDAEMGGGDILRKTVTIGFHSYDKNNDGIGTQDAQSKTVKYYLQIRKQGTIPWNTLVSASTTDTFDLDTTLYPDGTYELKSWAVNDSYTANGVTKDYIGSPQLITVNIIQNISPVISITNGSEFIDFTFGINNVYSPTLPGGVYKAYSDGGLISDPHATDWSQTTGIFVGINVKDADIGQYQKGTAILKDSLGNTIATANIQWSDDGSIIANSSVQSNNTDKKGYAYFDQSVFGNNVEKSGCIIRIEVQDYEDAACTVASGLITFTEQVSQADTTTLRVSIDTKAPSVAVPSITPDSPTQLSITANASDTAAGFPANAYQFNRDGIDIGVWQGNTYIDTGLLPNHQYTYKYKAKDNVDCISDYSAALSKYTLAYIPNNLTSTSISDNQIDLSWDDNGNPAGTIYELFCVDTGTSLYTGINTTYTHSGLNAGTSYTYKVRAINGDSVASNYTATLTCNTISNIPTLLTSSAQSSNSITLNWNANGNGAATRYSVFCIETGTEIYNGVATTYTHTSINANALYTYKVKAVNGDSISTGYTSNYSIYTLAAVPTLLGILNATNTSIDVSWNANSNTDGTVYELFCIETGTTLYTGTSTTFTHSGINEGDTFTYKVRAQNNDLVYSAYTGTQSFRISSTPTIPTISNVTATGLRASWNANGNPGTTNYIITLYNSADNSVIDNQTTTATQFDFVGLNSNVQYYFKVQAQIIGINCTGSSTSGNIYTLSSIPNIFINGATQSVINGTVNLLTNSVGTETYVEMADDALFTTNVVLIKDWNSSVAFNSIGLTPGTTYYFRVKARNADSVETGHSVIVNTVTVPTEPTMPSVGVVTATSIGLIWAAVTGATSYDIYRDGVLLGNSVGLSYTDNSVNPNHLYLYTVRAKNASGCSSDSPSTSKYTLALDPTASVTLNKETSLRIMMIDAGNTILPEYKCEIKLSGAGAGGASIYVSDWDTSLVRNLTGLTAATNYEVWITIRNGEDIENTPFKAINSVVTNTKPGISSDDLISDHIISNSGTFSFSGRAWDVNGDDITVSMNIGGTVKNVTIVGAPTTEPLVDNWALTFSGAEIIQGEYTNIIIKVTDGSGDSSEVTYTGKLILDKTAPVITLKESDTIYSYLGHIYTDYGATAFDNIDGDVSVGITTVNTVNTDAVGVYTVTYTVSDSVGNVATKIRTVNIVNKPVIVPPTFIVVDDNSKETSTDVTKVNNNTNIQITDEVISGVKDVLIEGISLAITEPTNTNNLTAGGLEMSISFIKSLDNLQKFINASSTVPINISYKLAITEKLSGNLVYIKQNIKNPTKVLIPNLVEATQYSINIAVMTDNKALAWRELTKITKDYTPPVIDKVILSSEKGITSVVVIASDTKSGLSNTPYQFSVKDDVVTGYDTNSDTTSYNIPKPLSVMLGEGNNGWVSNIWTNNNRIGGLKSGQYLSIKVADAQGNIAQTLVRITGKDEMVNAGINNLRPLTVQKGDTDIYEQQLLNDIYNNVQISNLKLTSDIKDYLKYLSLQKTVSQEYNEDLKLLISIIEKYLTEVDQGKRNDYYEQITGMINSLNKTYGESDDISKLLKDLLNTLQSYHQLPHITDSILNPDDYDFTSLNPDVGTFDKHGRLIATKEGSLVLDVRNNKTAETFKYAINVGKISFNRRIIVEKGSLTNTNIVFKKILLENFGKYSEQVSLKQNNYNITIDETGIMSAAKTGCTIITATYKTKIINFYVIVTEEKYPESDVRYINANSIYLTKVGAKINISKIASFYKMDNGLSLGKTEYLAVESLTNNIKVDSKQINCLAEGLAKVLLIDLVSKRTEIVDFYIYKPIPSAFKDLKKIKNTKVAASIDQLAKKGYIEGYGNNKYGPNDPATIEQFLTVLNRIMVDTNKTVKVDLKRLQTTFSLDSSSCYFVLNSLKDMTNYDVEDIFGSKPNFKSIVTVSQVSKIFELYNIKLDVNKALGKKVKTLSRSQMADILLNVYKQLLKK